MVNSTFSVKRCTGYEFDFNAQYNLVQQRIAVDRVLAKRVQEFTYQKEKEVGSILSRFDPRLVYSWMLEAGLFDDVLSDIWEYIAKRKREEQEYYERQHPKPEPIDWREVNAQANAKWEAEERMVGEFYDDFKAKTGHNLGDFPQTYIDGALASAGLPVYTDGKFPEFKPERKRRTFMCDFETTVYDGQTTTEVWAAAMTELFDGTDNVLIFHSLPEMFEYIKSLNCSMRLYFHNLKFDGWFWLSYLLKDLHFAPALDDTTGDPKVVKWWKEYQMPNNTFKCAISAMGSWYSITIKVNGKLIEIRDSLKLLPFSVKRIGKSFKTRHKKLDMEYTGYRYAGCNITEDERKYIANDVLVVKEALEFMFKEGHSKLTIGSCCLTEFRGGYYTDEYKNLFPNLYEIAIDANIFGSPNADAYVRKSYRGGWCYLVKGKEKRIFRNGMTADVNSLYPSMMSSESGNYFPVGNPTFHLPKNPLSVDSCLDELDEAERSGLYYFVRIKTRFYIKPGKLPFIQIKNSLRYACNECLETSDWYCEDDGQYYTHYWACGDTRDTMVLKDTRHELTMTMTDFKLFREHYHLVECEILDYCTFATKIGIFDNYIQPYAELKQKSEGAMRELAKLFLNNLYGKMASSTDSNFKIPRLKDDGTITFDQVDANDKKPGYIPCGSAITSYARNFTIRAAQKNYHGVDQPGFIYADTDSIHCDLTADQIVGITPHDTAFCCWKLEASWDVAWFTRQKTYIEHVTHENLKPIDKPFYNVKCAGMAERCKELFIKSLEGYEIQDTDDFTEAEAEAINKGYKLSDFDVGLTLPGKLMPKRLPGGVLLVNTTYEMR